MLSTDCWHLAYIMCNVLTYSYLPEVNNLCCFNALSLYSEVNNSCDTVLQVCNNSARYMYVLWTYYISVVFYV